MAYDDRRMPQKRGHARYYGANARIFETIASGHMKRTTWLVIVLLYLAFAEVLSWTPVPDLSLCLIEPAHNEQISNHNDPKYCPALHMAAALAIEKTDVFLERHDKSVIGAFTIVLALSTIGLWLATNKLWRAGERQFKLLAQTAAAQSRDMQASIKAAEDSVKIAKRAADIADRGVILADRPWIALDAEIKGPLKFLPETIEIEIRGTFKNVGRSPAVNVHFQLDMFTGTVEAGGKADDRARSYRSIPLLQMGYGVVLFPGADGFRQKTLSIKRADFIAAIKDIADSATEDDRKQEDFKPFTRMSPTIMAFCTYHLPSAERLSRARFTTLILDVDLKNDDFDGFDGSETVEVPADNLELAHTFISGETT